MTDNVSRSTRTHDAAALPDVSELALRKLLESGDSALAHSVRQVLAQAKRQSSDNYAAFGSIA